jgi:hypothetical protein
MVSQSWQDVSDRLLERRSLSVKFLDRFLDRKPKKPKLVSSVDGKLKKLLLTIPFGIVEELDNPIWKIYEDLFSKLPSYTELHMLVHEPAVAVISGWMDRNKIKNRIHFIPVPHYIDITIWAEDAYVIVEDNDSHERYFMEPNCFPRWGDGFVGNFASKALNYKRCWLPLYFEGGNMLIGDDFFLVGADYPVLSMNHMFDILAHKKEESKVELVQDLYKEFFDATRELILVGSTLPVPSREEKEFEMNGEIWKQYYYNKNEKGTVQPVFHIDMFISLAGRDPNGKYCVLVGDPRLAAQLLGQEVYPYAMVEIFDNIAENLQKINFEVIRNPLPLIYMDDEKTKVRTWHFATSNNAMVEIIDEKTKTVWLPSYGYGNWTELEVTDRRNKEIWENLGFKVVMLGDFHPFVEYSGSLHCIKKYLERG